MELGELLSPPFWGLFIFLGLSLIFILAREIKGIIKNRKDKIQMEKQIEKIKKILT